MRSSAERRGERLELVQALHASTVRDYVGRVVNDDKAACAEIAGRFGAEYWDGERRYGYGGYRYDGRWRGLAEKLAERYDLRAGARVLDVGCGKGYLLHELAQLVPGLEVRGVDVSAYALADAKEEVKPFLQLGTAAQLPFADASFDLVVSLGTLHNLALADLWAALGEIERVGRGANKYVMVESYRNEREKMNLLYWQLTCKSFYAVADWEWLYARAGYRGDYDFIFFTWKICELGELAERMKAARAAGARIVHAHGVFDLLHPGHIRHLAEAKTLGDVLVVTITEDRHVNKGPHRPAFPETLRAESLAALHAVDHVAINRAATAVPAIEAIRPHVYVKGPDYRSAADDMTGGIVREEAAVAAGGGVLHITEDLTFSSSALINQYLPTYPGDVQDYLRAFRERYSAGDVIAFLDRLRSLRVLVVGEAIVDEYIYCDQMGKSAKEPVLAMRYHSAETFAGGALAVANHLAEFCAGVDLVTYIGGVDDRAAFVRESLKPNIRLHAIVKSGAPTIVKRRYVEATLLTKLFEVYVIDDDDVSADEEAQLGSVLREQLACTDAAVVADYGHGLLTPASKALLAQAPFLAVNTQINAANIRYHAISSYPRADYVCINEAELRLDARNRSGPVEGLIAGLSTKLACDRFLVTRGKSGVLYFAGGETRSSPSLAVNVVDKIGAGDAVLALTSVAVAAGIPAEVVAFLANVIGAQKVQILGNRTAIGRAPTLKFIASLLK